MSIKSNKLYTRCANCGALIEVNHCHIDNRIKSHKESNRNYETIFSIEVDCSNCEHKISFELKELE